MSAEPLSREERDEFAAYANRVSPRWIEGLCAEEARREAAEERAERAVAILRPVAVEPGCCDQCDSIIAALTALAADDAARGGR